jgi:hypothetical protein
MTIRPPPSHESVSRFSGAVRKVQISDIGPSAYGHTAVGEISTGSGRTVMRLGFVAG